MLRMKKLIYLTMLGLAFVFATSVQAQDLNSALKLTYNEQFDVAEKAFDQLIKKEPAVGKNYFYAGDNYLATYLVDTVNVDLEPLAKKALAKFQQGTAAAPTDAFSFVGLGKVALFQHNLNSAKQYFTTAENMIPKKISKKMPKNDYSMILVKIAEAYVQMGSRDSATVLSLLRKAEDIDSKNMEVFLVRGDYFINTFNEGSKAIEAYRMAQYLAPESPRSKVRLGELNTRINRNNEAMNYYKEALEIDPNFAPAYLKMGTLASKMGSLADSKTYYKKYIDLSAGNVSAKRRYAATLLQNGDFKGAIEQIQLIRATDSATFNDLNRALGYAYFEDKDYSKAKYYMDKYSQNLNGSKLNVYDYIYYGKIMESLNDSQAVANYLEKAYAMDNKNNDVIVALTNAYRKIGSADSTKKIQCALREADIYKNKIGDVINKDNLTDYYRMGIAYYNAGRYSDADVVFSKVIQEEPDYIPAYAFKARSASGMDQDSKQGLAKPHYELLIQKAEVDPVKNKRELVEAYQYLGSYYYFNAKEYCLAADNFKKFLDLQPNPQFQQVYDDAQKRCAGPKAPPAPTKNGSNGKKR